MSKKRWWLRFHVWLGISVGLFWALQGLTGALLVFNRDLQGASYARAAPERSDALLPLDAIFRRASAAAGARVTKLESFGARPYLLLAYYQIRDGRDRTLIVDGRSGADLDDRSTDELIPKGSGFWPWLLRFHESLLGGDRGQFVVGGSGLLLLLSLAIGIWNAIPARGRIGAAFRVSRWRTLLQRFLGWHRMLGLLFGVPLLVSVLCGIYLADAPAIRPVLADHAGYLPMYQAVPQKKAPPQLVTAEQAWQRALARFPNSKLVRATTPSAKSPVYFFRLLRPGEWRRWAGTSWVAVDPRSGQIIASYDAVNGPWANWITDNLYTIHTGEAGGMVTRLIIFFDGLLLPTFFVTGFVTWRRRTAAKKLTRSARGARAAGSPSAPQRSVAVPVAGSESFERVLD
jgi:uncharacterized iron-regulated membrane protein